MRLIRFERCVARLLRFSFVPAVNREHNTSVTGVQSQADPPRYGPPRNLNFRGSRRMPFGGDTGIIQGYLLRTSHSLSSLSGTDSASIIPEIGFSDGGVGGGMYILLYARVHLNGDRNGERHPRDLRASGSYGDSKQQPGS